VKTDRDGGTALADVVILGEGVNGLVGQRSGLRSELKPDSVALAVKEMHFLPREVIESRFNLKGNEGVVIEAMGTITAGMTGTGFLYTNQESISVGIGCIVSDFAKMARRLTAFSKPSRITRALSRSWLTRNVRICGPSDSRRRL